MNPRGRLRATASFSDTSRVLAEVAKHLALETPLEDLQSIELGLAEVITNLVKHGYDSGQAGCINLHWQAGLHHVDLQITDCGRPIPEDRLAAAAVLPMDFENSQLEDLPDSGLGLALVMRVFDVVQYRSRGRVNRLRLRRILR